MRRALFAAMAALLLTLVVVLIAKPRTGRAHLKWDYDYAHDLPCTNARLKSCVRGFNVFDRDPSRGAKPIFVANRFDEKGQVVMKSIEARVNLERYGNVQFCVTAVGLDANGAAVESRPICESKFVIPLLVQDLRFDSR